MQISPVRIPLTFKSNNTIIKENTKTIGYLPYQTTRDIDTVLHAYADILEHLDQKTEAGLRSLEKEYPNITINEHITFHNCGKDNKSISIKVAESARNRGLTKIIVRKNNTWAGRREVVDAFLLKDNNKLVKEFNHTHMKQFPDTIEYESDKSITNYNEKLSNTINDLDEAMFLFRKFLIKNMDKNLRIPDGKLPYNITSKLYSIDKNTDETTKLYNGFYKHLRDKLNKEFDDYVSISGLQINTFKFPEADNITISYAPIENERLNELKRFVVCDKNSTPIKVFVVHNNKLISKLNTNYPNVLPNKIVYYNKEELANGVAQDFDTYISLYDTKLSSYKKHAEIYIQNKEKENLTGELSPQIQSNLKSLMKTYNNSVNKLKEMPAQQAANIKKAFPYLEVIAGRKGYTLLGFDNNKIITILPLTVKNKTNLLRITIKDLNNETEQIYLIKDLQRVVKNYNPEYPTIIPKILKFYNNEEHEGLNLEPATNYMKDKFIEFSMHIDNYIKEQEAIQTRKKEIKANKIKAENYKKEEKLKQKEEKNSLKQAQINKRNASILARIQREEERKQAKQKQINLRQEQLEQKRINAELKQRKREQLRAEQQHKKEELQLIKDCKKMFETSVKNMQKTDINNFLEIITNIQEKIQTFLNK